MKPPQWLREGLDPDYRFSLANERTFLAWVRTALAILAGAMVLHQLGVGLKIGRVAQYGAVALTLLSAALAAGAYVRWKANEVAMRHSRSLPMSALIPLLSLAAVLIALAATVAMLTHR